MLISTGKIENMKKTKIKNTNVPAKVRNITYLDYNEIINSKNLLKSFVESSIPVIIKNFPKNMFSDDLFKDVVIQTPNDNNTPKSKVIIKNYTFPNLGELGSFISKHFKKTVMYALVFGGGYSGAQAHIDTFMSYNFYYLKQGEKDVYIIPHEYTCYLDMTNGEESVFVGDDKPNTQNLKWLELLPEFYHFTLNEGDVLFFNNSKCIHKFSNKKGNELSCSIRLFSTDASNLIYQRDMFNWKIASSIADIFFNKFPTFERPTNLN
jgi:hypothetical protein